MKGLLAIDTSADLCSVCLVVPGAESEAGQNSVYTGSEIAARSHAQRVLPMVDGLLGQAGISLKDVEVIAYGRGPGSFTGLRIAVGMVQGLAFGCDIPTLGISNLAAIARFVLKDRKKPAYCLSMLDARMHEVYWGLYRLEDNGSVQLVSKECVNAPSDLDLKSLVTDLDGELFVAGSGLDYDSELIGLGDFSRVELVGFEPAQSIAEIALLRENNNDLLPAEKAAPIYIRDEVTWKKLPGRE